MAIPRPVLIGFTVAPIFAIAAAALIMCDAVTTEIRGEVRANGEAFGTWEMSSPACHSGEPKGFYGVTISDPEVDTTLRLIHEPNKEPRLVVEAIGKPGETVLQGSDCTTLDIKIRGTSKRLGRVTLVDGRATFDCAGLQGDIEFTSCR